MPSEPLWKVRYILGLAPNNDKRLSHHRSEQDLLTAAENGCRVCKQVVKQARMWTKDGSLPEYENREADSNPASYTWCIYAVDEEYPGTCTWEFFVRTSLRHPLEASTCAATFMVESVADCGTICAPVLPGNTGSESCWVQPLSWYHDCVQNHKTCQSAAKDTPWYPSWLLEVGTASEETVKLVVKENGRFDGLYLTLSHRWGTGAMYKLTTNLVEQFKMGILILDLPETFREAIEITRRLKVRYLWVDSLCIVQDSTEEWQRESLQMENVYTHSHLNIAATASESGDGGLFRCRQGDQEWPWSCEAVLDEGGENKKPCLIYDQDIRENELEKAPLNQRAWVLQERLLAPRVLHFCESQLFWECHEREACEKFPDQLPLPMISNGNLLGKSLDPLRFEARLGSLSRIGHLSQSAARPYQIWKNAVVLYMNCGITKAEDKLVAISGIAKHISHMVKDDYIAGHWRSEIPESLLWSVEHCVQGNRADSFRPSTYRAPSWSWASVEGNVLFHAQYDTDSKHLTEALEVRASAAILGDSFGHCAKAVIRLKGRLIGPLRIMNDRYKYYIDTGKESELQSQYIEPDTPHISGAGAVSCLPLVSHVHSTVGFLVHCLLVTSTKSGNEKEYERFGYAWFYGDAVTLFEHSIAGNTIRARAGCEVVETEMTLV